MNLIYMAKPIYGGWVTFTAHLCLKHNCNLFKIGKKTEKNKRKFGYNIEYQNTKIEELIEKPNLLVTAVDKHYWEYLDLLPDGTRVVVHDPTELKGKDNNLLKNINRFEVITIRKTVQEFLENTHQIKSTFLVHPFYEYPLDTFKDNYNYHALSISRIDFDKHTDLILKANLLLPEDKKIQIFGAENRLYVHHKLKELKFHDYWHGKFPKTLPLSHDNKDLLTCCNYIVDMSIIKGDGGGTQYTFLEAIYQDCALVLHKEWVDQGDTFKDKYNCYVVGYTEDIGKEIADILMKPVDKKILQNAKLLLKDHININYL